MSESDQHLAGELERLGIDVTTPEGRAEFRETFAWATKQRRRCEKIAGYVILVIIGGAITSAGSFAVDLLKTYLGKTP